MLKKNSLLTGILAALVSPAISVYVAYLLRYNPTVVSRPLIPYLAAIAVNLILMRILIKKEFDQTGRGIMLVTFAFMLVVFILRFHPIT